MSLYLWSKLLITTMKTRTAILWLALLLGFCSCTDKQGLTDTLHRAEALMNEYPDSALQLLCALPVADMQQTGNRARYALLYSQALDKNYIDETNDSLINIAVDYYRTTGDVRSKFLSFYYQGRVYTNAGESVKAMMAYTEAEQLVDEVKDGYLLGLLYTQIGNIYRNNFDSSKSLAAYKHAETNYTHAKKELHRLYALVGQASVHRDMNNLEESYQLLKRVKAEAEEINNRKLHSFCLSDLMMLCVVMERMQEARDLYNELTIQYSTDNKTAIFLGCVARLYASEGDRVNAYTTLSQAWNRVNIQSDSIVLFCDAAKVYELLHNPKEAYRNLELGVLMQNRIVRETLQQPIITVQRNYLADKLEFQNYKFRMEKKLQIIVGSLASIVVLFLFYIFVKRLRRYYRNSFKERLQKRESAHGKELERLKGILIQKEEGIQKQIKSLEKAITDNELLRQQMEELNNEIEQNHDALHQYMSESDKKIQNLTNEKNRHLVSFEKQFKGKIKLVDSILYSLRSDSEDKNAVIQRATLLYAQIFKEYKQKDKAYLALEEMVNTCYDDIIVKLRSEVILPNEDSYRQVCYHVAGFSVNVIALLMNETTNKLYKRRERIRDRIVAMDTLNKELFTKILFK